MNISSYQLHKSCNYDLLKIILEHVSNRISRMKPGERTTCRGLFEPWVWEAIPTSDRRHAIGPFVSMMVAQGKVPLEFAGFNQARRNLYRKI